MNIYLHNFIKKRKPGSALDFGAGQFSDVAYVKQLGWDCDGVDLNMGVDLNQPYLAQKRYDLIYSNYVLHIIKNRQVFINSVYNNLKKGGWLFLHALHEFDQISDRGLSTNEVGKLMSPFDNIQVRVFSLYDNEHLHWHRVIETIGQKPFTERAIKQKSSLH